MIPLLLADENAPYVQAIDSIRNAFTSGPSRQDSTILVIVLLVLALATFGAMWVFRRRENSATPEVPDLLTTAIDLLGLSEQERRDLRTLASATRPAQPAAMLLSPRNLAGVLAAVTPTADPELVGRIKQLSKRLFEMPLPEVLPATEPAQPNS
ncbi:MAG: hypothetical protein U1D55_14170 [Phycisphaerae bacterium]